MKTTEKTRVTNWNKNQHEYTSGNLKAVVKIDEFEHESPRQEFSNIWKLVIREHRNYIFPNELDFNWGNYDDNYEDYDGNKMENELEKIGGNYYIFRLDMYEHSGIRFSEVWTWIQCKFDTSRAIWFFAIPKEYNSYDCEEIHKTQYKEEWKYSPVKVTIEEAREIFEWELKDWNQWLSWEIYEWEVYKLVKRTSEDWREKEEREFFDGVCGYYNIEQAKDEAESFIIWRNE